MPQINVTIDGKNYRMACADGEEAHLTALAEGLDARVTEMRGTFGEIGDMRLHVMAALMQADALQEAQARLSTLEAEAASLRAIVDGAEALRAADAERLAEGLNRCTDRIERLAHTISAG